MPTKSRKSKPACGVCGGFMKVTRVIPAAHIYPELRTYRCNECGVSRTVENEKELEGEASVAA
jgi:hypothetical protein